MSERSSVRKWPAGSIGLTGDESSDSLVTFTMDGSPEMGNLSVCDITSKSAQWSVSKRIPEIHVYTYKHPIFVFKSHFLLPLSLMLIEEKITPVFLFVSLRLPQTVHDQGDD